MLECGRALRHDKVAAQARRDAAADDGAVRRAHERHGQRTQRSKAREGAPERGRSRSERCAAFVCVRAGAWREVRTGAAEYYRAYCSTFRGELCGRKRKVVP